jgi:hypothetical protein
MSRFIILSEQLENKFRGKFHFPFSILRLSFAIAGKADRSIQSEHWATSDAMASDKRKMENGK